MGASAPQSCSEQAIPHRIWNRRIEPSLRPTGAGKTNAAMLIILNGTAKHREKETGEFDHDTNKKGASKSLMSKSASLPETLQLTKQRIAEAQIVVTKPEKWDVITHKQTDTSYTKVTPTSQMNVEYIRLVGLFATLPDYQDVATFLTFLRVHKEKGLFYFDASYRPCGLQQHFISVTEKKAIKRCQITNEVSHEKVLDQASKSQTLVFVHSRKETAKTACFLHDMAIEKETITQFVGVAAH
ncbi:hypothetical protein D9619_011673 [Psilocybe cf. subviscida]|uniref:Uncharacterized protein n=1 Tax=Psilocybe cf. subviscida TaxID=2480587 RepID=A0A8H5BT82_9AGAR|nr:hypothetical protein D9619_011673 [Psilocybe cf. subviscida]